ncbi:universal stress protein, partial [Candidatus Bathyarchaeota archaeon]|nr:universal stress protein [Candidatus Bathyarchaeota archaeon]
MFNKILVPLDCPKFAESSLKVAIEIAKKFNSQLYLINVLPTRSQYRRSGMIGKILVKKADTEITEDEIPNVCINLLAKSKQIVETEGIQVQTLLKEGHVVEEILETIKKEEFDLVVIAARGQSMIKNLLLGSVSSGV